MYKITDFSPIAGHDGLKLTDESTGAHMTIIPTLGGSVGELVLKRNGGLVSVLEGYSEEEWRQKDFSKYRGAMLFPFPGRIAQGKYNFEGKQYQLPLNEGPPLSNALHGFLLGQELEVVARQSTESQATVILNYQYDGSYQGYPFPAKLELRYLFDAEGFTLKVQVINTGEGAMPLGFGFHPYLQLGAPARQLFVKIPSSFYMEISPESLLPTNRWVSTRKWEDYKKIGRTDFHLCFKANTGEERRGSTWVKNAETGLEVEVWQETGQEKFAFVQTYVPPQKDCVAIEPFTMAADGFNHGDGLIVLAPGKKAVMQAGIRLPQ